MSFRVKNRVQSYDYVELINEVLDHGSDGFKMTVQEILDDIITGHPGASLNDIVSGINQGVT